jgi:hypothetical protein
MTYPAQPTPPPPPGAPTQPPAKKGLGPLGWVLIGCGGLILVGALVLGALGWFAKKKIDQFAENPTFNAAKLAVQMNPELELVSADEKTNTLTIKNKKTGEVMTISAEDAKEGRWSVETKEGKTVFDGSAKEGTLTVTNDKGEVATWGAGTVKDVPSWVPSYPGGSVQGTFDSTTNEARSAAFTVTTKDSVEQVLNYYEEQLKNAGFKADKTSYATNGTTAGGSVTATSSDEKRTASVMVSTSGEGTTAIVTFTEKK